MAGELTRDGSGVGLTPHPALDAVLHDHAHALRAALGDVFVGLYPLGSLAVGDFDLTSDVDFVVVTAREPTAGEMERVGAAHARRVDLDSRWVQHLEYSLFPLATLQERSSPYGPRGHDDSPERQLWYFPNGGREVTRSDHDNTLVTRWTLRYRSRPVLGPEPATFAPEVTADELRREIRASMLGWEGLFTPDSFFNNRFHQVFFVLNNCRALQDLHQGEITSKREGVAWAKRHLDAEWHPLIDYCWRERQDTGISVTQPADPAAFARSMAFVAYTTRLAEAFEVR
ncbi:MAG: aminoglycoside adenylyltransferase domain-containing protein [Amnibacterium sp.]